jgi:hypothetical protein
MDIESAKKSTMSNKTGFPPGSQLSPSIAFKGNLKAGGLLILPARFVHTVFDVFCLH